MCCLSMGGVFFGFGFASFVSFVCVKFVSFVGFLVEYFRSILFACTILHVLKIKVS